MSKRMLATVALAAMLGMLVGWSARAFVAVDACLDAGGAWEPRGSYCYGAAPE